MSKLKFIVLLLFVVSVQAQEFNLPVKSQYMADNPFVISPAFAGIGPSYQARFSGVSQWLGLKDAPTTQTLSIDGRLFGRSAVGALLFNDKNGNTSQKGLHLTFAHHVTLSKVIDQFLSFGITYRYIQFGIDVSNFLDPDPATTKDISEKNSNFDVGILYRHNKFFLSLNASGLLNKVTRDFGNIEPENIRSYYGYMGVILDKIWPQVGVEPSVFVKYFEFDQRLSTDINLKVRKYSNKNYFWLGLTYRFLDENYSDPLSLSTFAGVKYKNFYVSYGFELELNNTIQYHSGSHMITIGFDFFYKPSRFRCTNSNFGITM